MKQNQHSEMIFSEQDVCDLLMQGRTVDSLSGMILESDVKFDITQLDPAPNFVRYDSTVEQISTAEFDRLQQSHWHMPDGYVQLDIAQHVLGLCKTDSELQRVAQELLLFQERGLFDLLRYLKYLTDVMIENKLIWGVGRGSSVASYVLYLLGIHKIDSLYYSLPIEEFLR